MSAPVKKKCVAIPVTMKSRYCDTVLSGGCNLIGLPLCLSKEPVGDGAVGKIFIRQYVPEHGQAALSLMVKAASPMPFHKALPTVGVQHCP